MDHRSFIATTLAKRRTACVKKVVLADDDAALVEGLGERFRNLGCEVSTAYNALDALNFIHRSRPDLACLDVNMPVGNGLSVCEMLKADAHLNGIPVIMLTSRDDPTTIKRCHDLLAYYVQKNADSWSRIEPLARELLNLPHESNIASPVVATADRMRDNTQFMEAVFAALGVEDSCVSKPAESITPSLTAEIPWVLCIDDDVDFTSSIKDLLERHGVAVSRAFTGMDGYFRANTGPANAILLDYSMPVGCGDYILEKLKATPATKHIPVIVITATRDHSLRLRMLAMGASEFLSKPLSFDELRTALAKHIDILPQAFNAASPTV